MQNKTSSEIDPTLFDIEAWKTLNIDAGVQVDANELVAALLNHITELDIDREFLVLHPESTSMRTIELIKNLYTIEEEDIVRNIPLEYEAKQPREKHTAISLEATALETVQNSASLTDWLNYAFKPVAAKIRIDDEEINAERQTSLVKTGNYVIFSLERNSWKKDEKTQLDEAHRLGTPISFPLKGLRLDPYFISKDALSQRTYDLVSIIMHSGSAKSGHYVAYVKSGNQWYYCDDEKVTKVNEKDVGEIAKRGYGVYLGEDKKNRVATTLVYELFSARGTYPPAKQVALNHLDPDKLYQNGSQSRASSSNSSTSSSGGSLSPAARAAIARSHNGTFKK